MATVTKLVLKHIPAYQRYVLFDSADLNDEGGAIAAGDIIQVERSLGRPARTVEISYDAASDLEVRLNTQHTIYPPHSGSEVTGVFQSDAYANLSAPVVVTSQTDVFPIGDGTGGDNTITGPIIDIKLEVHSAGTWTILAY